MWNMTTYNLKCKLNIHRLGRETCTNALKIIYLLLNRRQTPKKSLGLAQKIGLVGLVETNNFFLRLRVSLVMVLENEYLSLNRCCIMFQEVSLTCGLIV